MKKLFVMLLGVVLLSGAARAAEPFKVGFAFYNLSNPVWAEVVSEAARHGAEMGMEVTYVDAGQDSAKQIAQIENFIQGGMDAICVLAIDMAAVEPIAKEAMDKGIILVDYSRGMENCHATLTLNPITTGEALAQLAAKWIEEKYGKNPTFKWGFLDIPTVEIGVQEGNATEAEMLKLLPNSQKVANASTLTVEEGMKNTDAILQANPDLRVILSLSAGGGVGGNESIKTAIAPDQYADYALFSIDATEEEVLNILRGDPQKGSVSLGSGTMHGRQLIEYIGSLRDGKKLPKMNYLPIIPVTKDNAQSFYDEVFKK